MSYEQACSKHKFSDLLQEVAPIAIRPNDKQSYLEVAAAMKPDTYFIYEGGGIPEGSTYWITVIRLKNGMLMYNSTLIIAVMGDAIMTTSEPTERQWKAVFEVIGPEKLELSHYDYLELVIEDFWKRVFNKSLDEMWCAGIITAHGDKAYSYQDVWEEADISFKRGVLLFLLTYTKELGDTPKHESCEWVVNNYKKYLPLILESEKEAGF